MITKKIHHDNVKNINVQNVKLIFDENYREIKLKERKREEKVSDLQFH